MYAGGIQEGAPREQHAQGCPSRRRQPALKLLSLHIQHLHLQDEQEPHQGVRDSRPAVATAAAGVAAAKSSSALTALPLGHLAAARKVVKPRAAGALCSVMATPTAAPSASSPAKTAEPMARPSATVSSEHAPRVRRQCTGVSAPAREWISRPTNALLALSILPCTPVTASWWLAARAGLSLRTESAPEAAASWQTTCAPGQARARLLQGPRHCCWGAGGLGDHAPAAGPAEA